MIRSAAREGVRVVTFDRPGKRNAVAPADLDRLEAAVTGASEPVVLLCGAGTAFCAGADFEAVAAVSDPAAFARHGQRVADAIETADPVVVAGVDGAARGGGVELALAADVRVATPDATFGEPGVTFGLFGAWGGTVRLPRVMGEGDALDFALSGRVLDAEAARRTGLVSRIVDDPATVAREIARNEADALTVVKRLLRDRGSKAEREAAEAEAFMRLLREHGDDLGAGRDE